ncbi:MAG: hypothetical protein KatS3mg055_0746 [Chloroflexus sp.]|nr:MAG: hypothetical protein KatS3mg055_0746 [Chloroflexus sp.]
MQLWQGSLGHRTRCSRVAHVFGNGLTIIYRAGREHQMVVAAAKPASRRCAPLRQPDNALIGVDAEDWADRPSGCIDQQHARTPDHQHHH